MERIKNGGMTWWQILIIVSVAGIILDNMVTNICKAFVSKNKKDE